MKKPILASFLFGAFLSLAAGQQAVDPNWIQATPSAPFSPRFDPATVVFKNKLWVIGGSPYSGPATKEVWSSTDGKNWERVTDDAACLPRQGHTALVFKDKLWVIAGTTPKGGSVYYSRSDVCIRSRRTLYSKANGYYKVEIVGMQNPVHGDRLIRFMLTGRSGPC